MSGQIVAIGGGRYTDGEIENILQEIVRLSGKKNPRLLFLPTAGHDNTDGDEVILRIFEKFGCYTHTLLLTDKSLSDEHIKNVIFSADIVYAGGGNLKFLIDTWHATGADKYLKTAHENGTILSGYSSGAMCWFQEGWDDCGENGESMFVECLGILDGCNCPHFESGHWTEFEEEIKTRAVSGIACENGAAIIFDKNGVRTMHGNDGGKVYFFDKNNGFKKSEIK